MDNSAEKTKKSNGPVATKTPLSEWLRVCCKSVLIFELAIFAVGAAVFGIAFNAALVYSSTWGWILAVFGGVLTVFGASYPVDVLIDLSQGGVRYTVLYGDRVVIKAFLKDGRFSESSFAPDEYKSAKEYKKYIIAWASGKSTCLVDKRGLTDIQLDGVRGLFKLPTVGEAVELPKYAERERAIPKLDDCVKTDGVRCIKSRFGEYYSRDKALWLPRRIISGLLVLPCLFGFVVHEAALRTYDPLPIWATLVAWAAAVALIADIIWFMYMRRGLKRSERLVCDGVMSEYAIFADGIVVHISDGNSFGLTVIPYDKIARVRETKTDIQIDFPTKNGTYPIIKSALSEVEHNTLRKLLGLKYGGDTTELDAMPSVHPQLMKKPDIDR